MQLVIKGQLSRGFGGMGDRFDSVIPLIRIANRTGSGMATFETNYFFSGIETEEKKEEKEAPMSFLWSYCTLICGSDSQHP